jgi:predicted transport protein
LGADWRQIQEEWLHRLGNLTLTGYNPELSDRPFLDKRDHQEGGFCTSPLRLNQGLGQLERWDVDAIRQRGETLAARALDVWASPQLSEEQRQAYRQPSRRLVAGYTLDDHPQLANPQIREVFDALDARIQALDPNVSQEVLKLYIAYKAETNFVDIVPQAKRLRLSLNMPFAELDDPRGIAKNVTDVGRWGNGDVEIGVSTLDGVSYAIGLIRQSLERQLGDNGSTN